jgi:diguanylate cyclase (GGDEF)-like protein/PAS domain S-box-containing protein
LEHLDEGAPESVQPGPASPGSNVAQILNQLSQALADTTSSSEETLQIIARTAGTVLGGGCILWLLDDTGRALEVAAVYDADATRRAVLGQALDGAHHSTRDEVFAQALLAPHPVSANPAPWEEMTGWGDAGGPEVLGALGEVSLTLVPLRSRGTTPGVMGLVRPAALGEVQDLDKALLVQFADRVALAIDNARLLIAADRELNERRRQESVRRDREQTISSVARSGPILLFSCDNEGIITLMDGGLVTQFQRRAESFIGRSFLEVFGDYPVVSEHARRVLDGEPIRRAQIPFDGYHLEAWATPLRDETGTVNGFAGVVVDVSARVAAEAAVLQAARRQAALVEHASDVILVLTADGAIQYANPGVQRVLGYSWRAGDVIDVLAMVHPDDREACRAHIRRSLKHPGAQPPIQYRFQHASGAYRLVESIGNNLLDDPAIAGFVVTIRDVTEQRATEERLLANAARQAALADLGRWALVGLDYTDLVEDAVGVLADQLGVDIVHVFEALPDADFLTLAASRGQVVANNELLSADPTSSPASFALVTQEPVVSEDLRSEDRFDIPALWTRANAVSIVEVPVPGQDTPVGVLGVGRRVREPFAEEDVNFVKAVANVLAAATARNRAETAIRAQALQDPLTGLPNRLLLADHSAGSAAAPSTLEPMSGAERTVLVVDIDRFKEINDTLGHAIGDLVLLEVARRLERIGDPVELVARLGGDEFALVARKMETRDEEHALATRLLSVLGEPLDVGGVNLRLRGSIGIASADVDRDGSPLEVPALLRRAEVAMYQAKSEHRGIRRYSDDLERSSLSRLALASELAEAIDHHELELDYQPKVAANTGRVVGVEALVRWHHPTRGLLLPDVFVPLAEQTGIIRELTNWVLTKALAECSSWHRSGWDLPVAVNLSAGTVHDPALLDPVSDAIARSALPPHSVELEITESAVMLDPEGALRSLRAMTDRGIRFALDDFGTGYSSLAYLQRLPVSSVKIDKSFVKPLGESDVARAIVRAVVDLGHSLDLEVIAEGVDSAHVLQAAEALGCDAVQGFHVAMPMDPQRLSRWLNEQGRGREAEPVGPPTQGDVEG